MIEGDQNFDSLEVPHAQQDLVNFVKRAGGDDLSIVVFTARRTDDNFC